MCQPYKKKSVWKYLIPALLILAAIPTLASPFLKGYRTIIKPRLDQTASFEIVNDLDENCYFYLNNDNDACDSAFLVRKGKVVVVKLPEGEYDLFYACGKKWKGIEEKFGPTTEYYKANHSYKVSNDDIWTVTVYESSDGESNIEQICDNAAFAAFVTGFRLAAGIACELKDERYLFYDEMESASGEKATRI